MCGPCFRRQSGRCRPHPRAPSFVLAPSSSAPTPPHDRPQSRLHPHRAPRRHRDHRDPRRHPVPRVRPGQGRREEDRLPLATRSSSASATHLYTNDNDGALYHHHEQWVLDDGSLTENLPATAAECAGGGFGNSQAEKPWAVFFQPYMKSRELLFCPDGRHHPLEAAGDDHRGLQRRHGRGGGGVRRLAERRELPRPEGTADDVELPAQLDLHPQVVPLRDGGRPQRLRHRVGPRAGSTTRT